MHIDIFSFLVFNTTSSLFMSVALFLVWRNYVTDIQSGYRWAAALLLQALGWGIRLLTVYQPNLAYTGSFFTLLSLACMYHALAEFKQTKTPIAWVYGIAMLGFFAQTYFVLEVPNLTVKIAIMSLTAAILLAGCGCLLLVNPNTNQPVSHKLSGYTFAFMSSWLLTRAWYYAFWNVETITSLLHRNIIEDISTVTFNLASIVTTFGFLLMCNDKYFNDKKEAQLAQQEQEKQLQILSVAIEQSPASVVIADLDANLLYVNPKFTQVTGYSREEALGKNPRVLQSGLTSKQTFEQLWDTLTHGQVWHGELINRRKNGEIYWEDAHIAPVKNADGHTTHYVGVKLDISARKKAEQTLLAEKDFIEIALDSQRDTFFVFDPVLGKAIRWNNTFKETSGYSDEEIASMKAPDSYYSADDLKKIAFYLELLKQGQKVTLELSLICKDGHQVITEYAASFVQLKTATSCQNYILAVGRDISERKQIEVVLRESENKYRTLIEMIGDALFVADVETGRIIDCNAKACLLIGRDKQDIIGLHQIQLHPADKVEEYKPLFQQSSLTREAVVSDVLVLHQDGYTIPVDISSNTFELNGKRVIVGLFHDISEHKRQEQFLQKAKQTADQANQSKSEFLANMSHEIRTPMNAILGFGDILAGLITDKSQRYYVEAIQTSGKTLLQLINDILDLSKIEAGLLELHYQTVQIRTIVQDISIIFSHKLADKGILFSAEVADDVPDCVWMDEIRLRQILLNLVGNAVKFTQQGFIYVRVSFYPSTVDAPSNMILEIEDSGVGIAADQSERIFAAFTQHAGQGAQYGGTGLGLAICKRLVEIMGGTISVRSQVGQGSCFTVQIPQVRICDDALTPVPEQVLPPVTVSFQPATVLIVDDVEINRILLATYLADYPELRLEQAESAAQVLALVQAQHFDLILMDKKLPDGDGDELCKQIKQMPSYANVPIIMITASALSPNNEAEQEHYYDAHLNKPTSEAELVSTMHSLLAPHQYSPAHSEYEAAETGMAAESPDFGTPDDQPQTELIELLNSHYQARVTNLSHLDVVDIDELIELAEQLQDLANQYHCRLLYDWASRLKSHTELFDLDDLPTTLSSFTGLITELTSLQP